MPTIIGIMSVAGFAKYMGEVHDPRLPLQAELSQDSGQRIGKLLALAQHGERSLLF